MHHASRDHGNDGRTLNRKRSRSFDVNMPKPKGHRFTMMNLLTLAALVATGHAFSITPSNVARSSTMLLSSAEDSFDRRAFLSSGAIVTVGATMGTMPSLAEDNSRKACFLTTRLLPTIFPKL